MKENKIVNSIMFFIKLSLVALLISGCTLILFKDSNAFLFLEKVFFAICIVNGLNALIIIIGAYYIVKKEISNGSKDNHK